MSIGNRYISYSYLRTCSVIRSNHSQTLQMQNTQDGRAFELCQNFRGLQLFLLTCILQTIYVSLLSSSFDSIIFEVNVNYSLLMK